LATERKAAAIVAFEEAEKTCATFGGDSDPVNAALKIYNE